MSMTCPDCGGNQFQSVKLIYEGGVNTSVMSGYTLTPNGNGVSVGGFQGTNTSTSALAQRFAPPDTGRRKRVKERISSGYILAGVMVIPSAFVIYTALDSTSDDSSGLMTIGGLGMLAVICGILYSLSLSGALTEATLQDALAEKDARDWENSVVCLTCGSQFLLPSRNQDLPNNNNQPQSRGAPVKVSGKVIAPRIEITEKLTKDDITFEVVPIGKEIHVSSKPSGIDLYLGPEGRPQGVTPLVLHLPLGSHSLSGSLGTTFLFRGRIHVEYADSKSKVDSPQSSQTRPKVDIGADDVTSSLERLVNLLDKKLLTEEEFSAAKRALLQQKS